MYGQSAKESGCCKVVAIIDRGVGAINGGLTVFDAKPKLIQAYVLLKTKLKLNIQALQCFA